MEGIIILNLLISLGGIFAILAIYFLFKKDLEVKLKEKEIKEAQDGISALEKLSILFQELRKELETKLETTQKEIQDKLEKSVEKTAKIEEVAKVLESYSGDLKNLKEVLAGTKTRGTFGEKALEEILKELPNSVYERQYRIGLNIVDFVLKINDTIIPIDSKFPYSSYVKILSVENENEKEKFKKELIRALINHIKTIHEKYIVPLKTSVEYAIMYIPGEGLFYEILSNKDYSEIWDFAREKYVLITSPKTFEILCTQLGLILRKQEFAKNLNEIINNITQLEKDILEIATLLERAKNQLMNSSTNLEQAHRAFNKFAFNFKELIKKEIKLTEPEKEKVKTLL
jgi:DNA anti-recombination protein RmuC